MVKSRMYTSRSSIPQIRSVVRHSLLDMATFCTSRTSRLSFLASDRSIIRRCISRSRPLYYVAVIKHENSSTPYRMVRLMSTLEEVFTAKLYKRHHSVSTSSSHGISPHSPNLSDWIQCVEQSRKLQPAHVFDQSALQCHGRDH